MMSMSTNDRQLLESIDAALHRIDDGTYGSVFIALSRFWRSVWKLCPGPGIVCVVADLNERGLLHRDED